LGRKGKCEPAHTSIEKISVPLKSEAATGGDLASNRGRGTMPATKKYSNLCSVDYGVSAPRLIVLWGRPSEILRHLEIGHVHDRECRQQGARKCVRQAGGGLSHIYGCWSRVRIRDHERR